MSAQFLRDLKVLQNKIDLLEKESKSANELIAELTLRVKTLERPTIRLKRGENG